MIFVEYSDDEITEGDGNSEIALLGSFTNASSNENLDLSHEPENYDSNLNMESNTTFDKTIAAKHEVSKPF